MLTRYFSCDEKLESHELDLMRFFSPILKSGTVVSAGHSSHRALPGQVQRVKEVDSGHNRRLCLPPVVSVVS